MKLKDGADLFYRAWLPAGTTDKALVLFHRGHEHSGRWQETVEALALDDVAALLPGTRAGMAGRPASAVRPRTSPTVIQGMGAFGPFSLGEARYRPRNMIVLAHSVGQ